MTTSIAVHRFYWPEAGAHMISLVRLTAVCLKIFKAHQCHSQGPLLLAPSLPHVSHCWNIHWQSVLMVSNGCGLWASWHSSIPTHGQWRQASVCMPLPWQTNDEGVSPGCTLAVTNTTLCLSPRTRFSGFVMVSRSSLRCCWNQQNNTCKYNLPP